MKNKTIANQVQLSGVGLHTGNTCTLTLSPNTENTGIVMEDSVSGKHVKLGLNLITSTNRSTNIEVGESSIHTIEHLLSACAAKGVNNIVIKVEGSEVPIMDGSAVPFLNLLKEAGVTEIDNDQSCISLSSSFHFSDEVTGASYSYEPSDTSEYRCLLDFEGTTIGQQFASIVDFQGYDTDIAPAKTFVFVHELEALLDLGLIKGGSFENALVFASKRYTDDELKALADKFGVEPSSVSHGKVLNEEAKKFRNEPARHKLLDLIGDLYLLGKPIKGKITALKPGHTSNVKFAKALLQEFKKQEKTKDVPFYDPNVEPQIDLEGVKQLIPHRHPFLLVDKVLSCDENRVIAVKNISFDQACFSGHFPNNPVYPGVLQMEALAQTGGVLALSTVPDPENYDTYFLRMNHVKFKRLVRPGDTLILKMELLAPIRRGIVKMQGTAYVGDEIVSEGELTAKIQKRTDVK